MSGQIEPLTTLLACKTLALLPGLSSSARQVGCAIIDHFNRKSGRCDPSIPRLGRLLGIDVRTVIRAIHELDRRELMIKVRHGGRSQRNLYVPNWAVLAKHHADWLKALKGEETPVVQ